MPPCSACARVLVSLCGVHAFSQTAFAKVVALTGLLGPFFKTTLGWQPFFSCSGRTCKCGNSTATAASTTTVLPGIGFEWRDACPVTSSVGTCECAGLGD